MKNPYAEMLVTGQKTVEIRGSATEVGRTVAIALSGSKTLLGEVRLESCQLVAVKNAAGQLEDVVGSEHTLASLKAQHRIENPMESVSYNKVYAWFVSSPLRYLVPVAYSHPTGAQLWVKLSGKEQEPKSKALPKSKAKPKRKTRKA